jgi:hypothetical protein
MEGEKQLEGDAGFMDKYSRQIGAFGLETMAKVRSPGDSYRPRYRDSPVANKISRLVSL